MRKIYLVDDDENILTSVSMFLESEGYKVRCFHDGASALEVLNNEPPDLAVFDVKMPRMDGLELLRRLRQSSNLPVIFLTSKDDEFDEAIGFSMGADDYITKPFSQRLLGERIKAVLRRAKAGSVETPMPQEGDDKVITRGSLVLVPLTGWVHHAVMADHADFANIQVYVAGRFEMAKTIRDDLTARGLKLENLFGDAFAFI